MSTITHEEFCSHFTTYVRYVERGHVDATGAHEYSVGLSVVCVPNGRVMYFESHLDDIPSSTSEPSDEALVEAAWSNLRPSIKSWATSALGAPSLVGSTFTPASNIVTSPADFDSHFTVHVARLDVYPVITPPQAWCVGFHVCRTSLSSSSSSSSSLSSFYVDTQVKVDTFANTLDETELLEKGWSNVRPSVETWATQSLSISPLVSSVFDVSSSTSPSTW
jgi:hypothetical protein